MSPGRPPVPQDVKDARKFDRFRVDRLYQRFSEMPYPELEAFYLGKLGDGLEMMIAGAIVKCVTNGDTTRLETILGRKIGPVHKIIDVRGETLFDVMREATLAIASARDVTPNDNDTGI